MFQMSGQGPYYGQASWSVPRADGLCLVVRCFAIKQHVEICCIRAPSALSDNLFIRFHVLHSIAPKPRRTDMQPLSTQFRHLSEHVIIPRILVASATVSVGIVDSAFCAKVCNRMRHPPNAKTAAQLVTVLLSSAPFVPT